MARFSVTLIQFTSNETYFTIHVDSYEGKKNSASHEFEPKGTLR